MGFYGRPGSITAITDSLVTHSPFEAHEFNKRGTGVAGHDGHVMLEQKWRIAIGSNKNWAKQYI